VLSLRRKVGRGLALRRGVPVAEHGPFLMRLHLRASGAIEAHQNRVRLMVFGVFFFFWVALCVWGGCRAGGGFASMIKIESGGFADSSKFVEHLAAPQNPRTSTYR